MAQQLYWIALDRTGTGFNHIKTQQFLISAERKENNVKIKAVYHSDMLNI